jgi:hypothetical protein
MKIPLGLILLASAITIVVWPLRLRHFATTPRENKALKVQLVRDIKQIETLSSNRENNLASSDTEQIFDILMQPGGRFTSCIDRLSLKGLTEEGSVSNQLIKEFDIRENTVNAVRRELQELLERFRLLEIENMRSEMDQEGNAMLLVPERVDFQAELVKQSARNLLRFIDDPNKALALAHIISRDYNRHGTHELRYYVFNSEKSDGSRLFHVEEVEITHGRLSSQKTVASATSLEALPPPFSKLYPTSK